MKPEIAQKILQKTKQDYEDLAEVFSASRAWPWLEAKYLVEKYVKNGMKILDLGCGNGRLAELLKNKSVDYIGVDNCEKLIEIAKRKLKIQNYKLKINPKFKIQNSKLETSLSYKLQAISYKFLVADALDLPLENESFDLVFAVALLHHFPSEELRRKVLQNCYRVLKPGGWLILTVWNFWQPKLLIKYKIWPIIFGQHQRDLDQRDVLIPWKMRLSRPSSPDHIPCLSDLSHFKIIRRYYHAFTSKELLNLVRGVGFIIKDNYYVCRGQRTGWLDGYNLVVVAKK